MNAQNTLDELMLASYEMAEAESFERRAHKLRVDAAKRLALIHMDIRAALQSHDAKKHAATLAK